MFKELGGDTASNTDEAPDAAESKAFWEKIWSVETEHDKEACWLGDIRKQMAQVERMDDVVVNLDTVRRGVGRMTNWKAPGPDQVRGFLVQETHFFKNVLSLFFMFILHFYLCQITAAMSFILEPNHK